MRGWFCDRSSGMSCRHRICCRHCRSRIWCYYFRLYRSPSCCWGSVRGRSKTRRMLLKCHRNQGRIKQKHVHISATKMGRRPRTLHVFNTITYFKRSTKMERRLRTLYNIPVTNSCLTNCFIAYSFPLYNVKCMFSL